LRWSVALSDRLHFDKSTFVKFVRSDAIAIQSEIPFRKDFRVVLALNLNTAREKRSRGSRAFDSTEEVRRDAGSA
jgi:hypothetical protein